MDLNFYLKKLLFILQYLQYETARSISGSLKKEIDLIELRKSEPISFTKNFILNYLASDFDYLNYFINRNKIITHHKYFKNMYLPGYYCSDQWSEGDCIPLIKIKREMLRSLKMKTFVPSANMIDFVVEHHPLNYNSSFTNKTKKATTEMYLAQLFDCAPEAEIKKIRATYNFIIPAT